MQRLYSWETLNPAIERIDVLFASNTLQKFITETGIVPPNQTCSNHGIAYLRIRGYGIPTRGPGVWKFNNALLTEQDFVVQMRALIPKWIIESEKDLPNSSSSQWGFVKHKIGEFSRNYGAKLKKAKNLLKTNIEAELGQLLGFTDLDSKNRYQILKSQLDEIIENEIQGSILRSLCKDYEDGEHCTQYFFSLEKN